MGEAPVLDCVGVPEYFATHIGAMEDAGSGLVRVIHCIERGGVSIPVFSAVRPALSILRDGPGLREVALKVACNHGTGTDMVH